jgi:hypothetical protein
MSDENNSNVATEEVVDESQETDSPETPELSAEEAAIQEAKESGASKEEIKELRKMFQLKVNGKTINKEYNLLDEETMKRELQMAHAGREAMQRVSDYEKALSSLIEEIKRDPFHVANQLGLTEEQLEELAYNKLHRKVEEAKKPKEVLEQEKLQKELQEYRDKLKKIEEEKVQIEKARLEEKAQIELDQEINEALDQFKVLPNHPYVIERIARTLLWATDENVAAEHGYDPNSVKIADVLPIVEAELKKDISSLLDSVPDDVLDSYVGKKVSERQRQKRLASMKKTSNISNLKKETAPVSEKKEEKKKMRLEDIPLF